MLRTNFHILSNLYCLTQGWALADFCIARFHGLGNRSRPGSWHTAGIIGRCDYDDLRLSSCIPFATGWSFEMGCVFSHTLLILCHYYSSHYEMDSSERQMSSSTGSYQNNSSPSLRMNFSGLMRGKGPNFHM